MTDRIELEPCPFCGSKAELDDLGPNHKFAYCPNDECFVQPETGAFLDEADAIAKWNTRTLQPPTDREAIRAPIELRKLVAELDNPWAENSTTEARGKLPGWAVALMHRAALALALSPSDRGGGDSE